MENKSITLAVIGCTGHVTGLFADEFYKLGVKLRILASRPDELALKYPDAEIIKGSMMDSEDVRRVMEKADATFFCTPMGIRNRKMLEVTAGESIVEGAKKAGIKQLIYVSVLRSDKPSENSIIDAKYDVEQVISTSGIPYTAIRCGSYMEDVFAPRVSVIKRGTFLFPVNKERIFTYTPQKQIPSFVVSELLQKGKVMNGGFNFTSPCKYKITEVEQLLSKYTGKKVKATGDFPLLQILSLLMPFFNWRKHRFSSIVPLLHYFNKYGYVDGGQTTADLFPDFKMTTLEDYLKQLLRK